MAVYERAAKAVGKKDQLEVWQLYIKRASEVFGVTHTRAIYERAIESLPDNGARVIGLQFAELERKVGRSLAPSLAEPKHTHTRAHTLTHTRVR